ncbi:hypothetical protein [Alloprevotella tannerae]|nr:hypothetical protein [Alloprevotella tannerae]
MSEKSKMRKIERDRKAAHQARRVINGIFFGLISLIVLILILYYWLFS